MKVVASSSRRRWAAITTDDWVITSASVIVRTTLTSVNMRAIPAALQRWRHAVPTAPAISVRIMLRYL